MKTMDHFHILESERKEWGETEEEWREKGVQQSVISASLSKIEMAYGDAIEDELQLR